jgi:hypothetical protein
MTKRSLLLLLPVLASPVLAAAGPPDQPQQQPLSLTVLPPATYPFTARVQAPARPQAGPVYEPAPLPNPRVLPPTRADSGGTEIAPSLFNRRDGFRGAALSRGDSAESVQNSNLKPSAGFTLKMPLDPTGGQTPQ